MVSSDLYAGLSSDTSSSPIVSTSVGQWLSTLGLADYENLFINYGFDDLDFIVRACTLYLLCFLKIQSHTNFVIDKLDKILLNIFTNMNRIKSKLF